MDTTDQYLDDNIKKVIETDIFEYLEINDFNDQQKEKIIESIFLALRSKIMIRIANILEQNNQDSFDKFKELLDTDEPDNQKIAQFLSENKINFDQITAEESILLKSEIMEAKDKQRDTNA